MLISVAFTTQRVFHMYVSMSQSLHLVVTVTAGKGWIGCECDPVVALPKES